MIACNRVILRTNVILSPAAKRGINSAKNLGVSLVFVLLLSKPTLAFSSRLTLPLSTNTTLVLEKKDTTESQTAIISDSLSSTKTILSSDGTTIETPNYYPYGSNVAIQQFNNPNNRYYTGQRKIPDDNLYNYNARYYNPDTGVFTQPDSVQGLNRFAYVGGNPIMNNDPTGQCVQCNQWWMDKLITGGHPWVAQSFWKDPLHASLAKIDAWTGIPSFMAGADRSASGNWFDKDLVQSKQYVSKSEAEAGAMIATAVSVSGADALLAGKIAQTAGAIKEAGTVVTAERRLQEFMEGQDIVSQAMFQDLVVNQGTLDRVRLYDDLPLNRKIQWDTGGVAGSSDIGLNSELLRESPNATLVHELYHYGPQAKQPLIMDSETWAIDPIQYALNEMEAESAAGKVYSRYANRLGLGREPETLSVFQRSSEYVGRRANEARNLISQTTEALDPLITNHSMFRHAVGQ